MAKPNKASPEAQEIIAGQNEFDSRLPKDFTKRVSLLDNLKSVREKLNDRIAQAKKDLGLSDIERTLVEQNGYTPQSLKIIAILDGMPARSRAATIRQINLRAEDKAWIMPDMFDAGSVSARQEGPAADQRSPEEMKASHDLDAEDDTEEGEGDEERLISSADARKALDAYLADHPRKRGTKPKELVRLDKQLEDALAREGGPADNVVNLGGQMRGTADAGEAHIREQAKDAAKATAEQPAVADPAPEPAAKAKRAPRKKAEPAPAPAKDGPAALDDDEEDAPEAPAPGGPIGSVPSSFSMA